MAPVIEAFTRQANAVVEKHGVGAEDVYQWARENAPGELQKAMSRLGTMRQTGGFNDLAQRYVQNLDTINPAAILNADFGPGVTVKREAGGKLIVHTDRGDSYPWQSAIKAGIIKLSRSR